MKSMLGEGQQDKGTGAGKSSVAWGVGWGSGFNVRMRSKRGWRKRSELVPEALGSH